VVNHGTTNRGLASKQYVHVVHPLLAPPPLACADLLRVEGEASLVRALKTLDRLSAEAHAQVSACAAIPSATGLVLHFTRAEYRLVHK
jgi:hypothetical protein